MVRDEMNKALMNNLSDEEFIRMMENVTRPVNDLLQGSIDRLKDLVDANDDSVLEIELEELQDQHDTLEGRYIELEDEFETYRAENPSAEEV